MTALCSRRGYRTFVTLLLCAAAAYGCGQRSWSGDVCDLAAKTPVLFVHGSNLTSETWQPMLEAFARSGYPPEFLVAIDMLPRDGDNIAAAERFIAPAVESLHEGKTEYLSRRGCSGSGPGKVDIVAHSMGAVSARWYANRMAPEKIRTLLTIAGANHGTDKLCGTPGAGDAQLCPAFSESGSVDNLQSTLNGTRAEHIDETPYGIGIDERSDTRIAPTEHRRIRFFTVRIDPDEWIVPADSATLDGAGTAAVDTRRFASVRETSPGNFLFLGNISHDDLPADPGLIQFVLFLLS